MFEAVGLVFLFLIGLPISFVIGGLIGYFVWRYYKNRQSKKYIYYIVIGGLLYILSQPLALLLVGILDKPLRTIDFLVFKIEPYNSGFLTLSGEIVAVLFAIFFTLGILTLLIKN
jgi:hypothetical protein